MPGIAATMKEYSAGTLHSGRGKKGKKGPKVKSRKQAIAIGLSQERRMGHKVAPRERGKAMRRAVMARV